MEAATELRRVGYPGPPGSHSAAAALVLAGGAELVALPSFAEVVRATVEQEVAVGVLPIENSMAGAIAETHDLLFESPLSIVAELTLPIVHCLAVLPGTRLEEIALLRSHPAAFDQCRDLLAAQAPQRVPAATTADAAREVAESGDHTEAAIASREAAAAYGLEILAEDISDHPAQTRFVAIAPYTLLGARHLADEPWRTALSFVTDHRPGALYRTLEPFERHGLNLVQLVSRPLPRSLWRYRFDVVLDGHVFDAEVRAAMAEVAALSRELKLLGSYAAELVPSS